MGSYWPAGDGKWGQADLTGNVWEYTLDWSNQPYRLTACSDCADLVKPEEKLMLAYDDPLGVTAAFNRNLLVRINRELEADFTLDAFSHRAVWNAEESRIEMHLVSRRPQRVRIKAAALDFEIDAGESIWTESSYKYRPESIVAMLVPVGFRLVEQWRDEENGFALTLVEAV